MNVLATTFWGEGISDDRFLPIIAQRVVETLLKACARGEWEVYEPQILKTNEHKFVQQVLDISKQSAGYNILFIHTDADATDENKKALPNKIEPAKDAIKQTAKDKYCHYLVPIVPVVKVENWKIVDGDALREALGLSLTDSEMGINMPARVLEQKGSSKEMLQSIMRLAHTRSRFAPEMDDLDAFLSRNIRLEVLMRLLSFQVFVERLKEQLYAQNIIEINCDEL